MKYMDSMAIANHLHNTSVTMQIHTYCDTCL
jgi:hypothetical protein